MASPTASTTRDRRSCGRVRRKSPSCIGSSCTRPASRWPRSSRAEAMNYETLVYDQDDHVTVLTYNRPHARNAVSVQMNEELHHAWQRFRDDDDSFVLVITGAGDAFCAGWDLEDVSNWPDTDWEEFRRFLFNSPGSCGYTRRVDVFKPVIAAVNGWAVAAGLENALLADIRIVAENAVFGALERRWNIVAGDGMTVRLPLAVGYAKAMELIITGRPVGAEEALRIGLANEVVPRDRRSREHSSWRTRSPLYPRARFAPTRKPWSETSAAPTRNSFETSWKWPSRCSCAATRMRSEPRRSRTARFRSGPTTGCEAAPATRQPVTLATQRSPLLWLRAMPATWSLPAALSILRAIEKEPLGPLVVAVPRKATAPLSFSLTCHLTPLRF